MSFDQNGRPIYQNWHNFGSYRYNDNKTGVRETDEFKAGVLRVSPCVVAVVSLGVPPEMTMCDPFGRSLTDRVFIGQGTIIECEKNAGDDKYSTTILTSATIFIRTNHVQPEDIEVEVYLTGRVICKGKVFACDFHYNLALVTIQMDTPIRPAKLRDLDDIMSIHVTHEEDHSHSFQLRPHSTSFKIRPGDKVASLARSTEFEFFASFGQFSSNKPILDCKELYSISTNYRDFQPLVLLGRICSVHSLVDDIGSLTTFHDVCGCPIINVHGEVIGIFAAAMTFLPSNIVSRWWSYYKKFKKYCRPWLGLSVANLYSADLNFLDSFIRKFPDVSSGIVVLKVEENSAAHISGLRREDVIVQCDGDIVGSTLDLFDKIWDKVGAPVTLSFLRKAARMNVQTTVGEARTDKFYRWPVRPWMSRSVVDPSPDSDLDSEMSESSHAESPVLPCLPSLDELDFSSDSDFDSDMPESSNPK